MGLASEAHAAVSVREKPAFHTSAALVGAGAGDLIPVRLPLLAPNFCSSPSLLSSLLLCPHDSFCIFSASG